MVDHDCELQTLSQFQSYLFSRLVEAGKTVIVFVVYMTVVRIIWRIIARIVAYVEPQDPSFQPSDHSEDAPVQKPSDAYSVTPSPSDNDTGASSPECGTERSKPWYAEPKIVDETAATLNGDILFLEDKHIHDCWQCNEKLITLRNPYVTHEGSSVQRIFLKWSPLQVYTWAIELQSNLENFFRAQESGLIGIGKLRNILCELQVRADELQGRHAPILACRLARIDSWIKAIHGYQKQVCKGLPRPLEEYQRITMRVQEMLRDMETHHLKYRNSASRKNLFRSLEKLYELHEIMEVSHRQCNLGFQMACKTFDNELTLANKWLAEVACWRKNGYWGIRRLVKLDNFIDGLRNI